MSRILITNYGVRKGTLWVRGEVHVSVPWSFYVEAARRYAKPLGDNVAGVDVNSNRVNLAILDNNGNILDYRTFWFREVTARGYLRRSTWSVIGMRVHDMLRYAYHHGVEKVFLENPMVLGRLKLAWIREGNEAT